MAVERGRHQREMQHLQSLFDSRVQVLGLQVQEAQGLYSHVAAELANQGSPSHPVGGGRVASCLPVVGSQVATAGGGPPGPPPGPGASGTLDDSPGTSKGVRPDGKDIAPPRPRVRYPCPGWAHRVVHLPIHRMRLLVFSKRVARALKRLRLRALKLLSGFLVPLRYD